LLCVPFRLAIIYTLFAVAGLTAQTPAISQPETTHLENMPEVPGLSTIFRGFNAGVTFSGVHDSSIGWYTVVTPAINYTFSQHYSVDVSTSLYPYRLVPNDNTTDAGNRLIKTTWDAGDTWIGAHASFYPHKFQNTATASMTLPSGNRDDGLSTGRVTFDVSNHVERYFGNIGGLIDVGGGDSSALFNRLVTKDYSSLGPLAHFQAGLILWLPGRNYIQSLAYEQLPIGDQKIYTTLGDPHGMGPSTTIVSGRNVSEDNGFTTSVGIPLTEHITFSGYYNRSLRLHLDTVSTGITYVFKGTPLKRKLSQYDKALLEGERLLNQ
jgi:hypothetical protein